MRISKYILLALLVFLGDGALSQETCCQRNVGTIIQVPAGVSSFISRQAWDSVFTKRQYGGGPLLDDCPLMIDMIETGAASHAHLDYSFNGNITKKAADQFLLNMQLLDNHHGQVVKEGQIAWVCADNITCSKALQDNAKALATSFQPLDDILHDYERMPESAQLEPEKDPIMAGKKMTIYTRDIIDSKRRRSQPWQRILAKAEKGEILNGIPREDDYRVFEVGDGSIDLIYKAPDECKNQTETITIYNSCDIDPSQAANIAPEKEIARVKFDILCDRWEGTFTYTEQVSGIYMEHKANRLYSVTVKATFDLKEADEYQVRYESEDVYIDLHDSFQQTAVGGLQESFKASKQGRIPMKASLEFLPKVKDDPSDVSWYNVAFEEWEGSPVIYSFRSRIPLFGQNCAGQSELTHGALYLLDDMTVERCTYKDNQTLLTGDYSWNDPLGPSVDPAPWDCSDVMGLPVSIPNMTYHKHLEWKIQKSGK